MGDHASRPIAREEDRENSFVQLRVMTEPRMMIRSGGAIKDLVAVDDLGQSLLPANPEGEQERFDFGYSTAAYVLGQVPLKRAGRPGRAVRSLRGVAPVSVAVRRHEPLIIPLAGAGGRSFRGADSVVTIRAAKADAGEERIVVEVIKPGDRPRDTEAARRPGLALALSIRPADQPGAPARSGRAIGQSIRGRRRRREGLGRLAVAVRQRGHPAAGRARCPGPREVRR